jgi:hypothetical protein
LLLVVDPEERAKATTKGTKNFTKGCVSPIAYAQKKPRSEDLGCSWLVARIKLDATSARENSTHVRCAAKAGQQKFSLRRPARAHRQIPHLRENARHLHSVQLREKRQHFRHERILQQFPNLFLTIAFAASQKVRNRDLVRARQPL